MAVHVIVSVTVCRCFYKIVEASVFLLLSANACACVVHCAATLKSLIIDLLRYRYGGTTLPSREKSYKSRSGA